MPGATGGYDNVTSHQLSPFGQFVDCSDVGGGLACLAVKQNSIAELNGKYLTTSQFLTLARQSYAR